MEFNEKQILMVLDYCFKNFDQVKDPFGKKKILSPELIMEYLTKDQKQVEEEITRQNTAKIEEIDAKIAELEKQKVEVTTSINNK